MSKFSCGMLAGLGIGLFAAVLLQPILPASGPAILRQALATAGVAIAIAAIVFSKQGRLGAEAAR